MQHLDWSIAAGLCAGRKGEADGLDWLRLPIPVPPKNVRVPFSELFRAAEEAQRMVHLALVVWLLAGAILLAVVAWRKGHRPGSRPMPAGQRERQPAPPTPRDNKEAAPARP